MLDVGGRSVWSHVHNNYYFRVNHYRIGFFTLRNNMEGFVCSCVNFIPICCMLTSSCKQVIFGKACGIFTTICSMVLQTGTATQPKQLSCDCWPWIQPSESQELALSVMVSTQATVGKQFWESSWIIQHFLLGSFSSKLGNYSLIIFLFTMKTSLQARQNNIFCYRCQDMIAHLRRKEFVMVSVLLMVNNDSLVKQHLHISWCLTIKH